MSVVARRLILGFAVLGLGFAGASAWVHYKLVTDPTYLSPCDVSATFNCSQVYLSQYGSIWGIPVALGGVIWFTLVALIAWFVTPTRAGVATPQPGGAYIFALATIGLAAILYLGYASFFVLKTGCLLCIGTYVSVAAIFLVAGASNSMSVGRLPGRLFADVRAVFANPTAMLVATLFIVGSASVIAFFPKESSIVAGAPGAAASGQKVAEAVPQDLEQAFTKAWWLQNRVDLGVPADGAKVVVVKFIDWQCPTCRLAHNWYIPVFERFAQSHSGQVKQVIKDLPLSMKCNFTMPRDLHQAACEAAVAARIARDKGKESEFVDWIFTLVPDQQALTAKDFKDKVTALVGLSSADFDKEYAARIEAIKRDVADANVLNISSTPTYFINGVLAKTQDGLLTPSLFELAIKLELNKAEAK